MTTEQNNMLKTIYDKINSNGGLGGSSPWGDGTWVMTGYCYSSNNQNPNPTKYMCYAYWKFNWSYGGHGKTVLPKDFYNRVIAANSANGTVHYTSTDRHYKLYAIPADAAYIPEAIDPEKEGACYLWGPIDYENFLHVLPW